MRRRVLRLVSVVVLASLSGACGAGYYLQAAAGHAELMRARRPLEAVLADRAVPEQVRHKLLVVDSALVFARVHLGLRESHSYRHYADLGRPFVVWNVFAAGAFSLEPREWCYPVAGCTTYRGWFSEARAREYAAKLARGGNDVFIGGVPAYSTLGWFSDPVLNTMLRQSDAEVAGLIFHELAHRKAYVAGDPMFNEGFASFVEEQGVQLWLESKRDFAALCAEHERLRRRAAVLAILNRLRESLAVLYASPLSRDEMRAGRETRFEQARDEYAALRRLWTSPPWFDVWFDSGLNNARLVALATYEEHVPAFRALYVQESGDLAAFFRRVEAMTSLDAESRAGTLARLAESPGATSPGRTAGTGRCAPAQRRARRL